MALTFTVALAAAALAQQPPPPDPARITCSGDVLSEVGGSQRSEEMTITRTGGMATVTSTALVDITACGRYQRGNICTQPDPATAICPAPNGFAVRFGAGDDKLTLGTFEPQGVERFDIDGQEGNDTFDGRGASFVIVAQGGEGNDTLLTGSGPDRVAGRAGDDVIDTGAGADHISGEEGNDRIVAGDGDDRPFGNAGADTIDAGDGNDIGGGGEDADTIDAGPGDDIFSGAEGLDSVRGGSGDDLLFGSGDRNERDAIDCGSGVLDAASASPADAVDGCDLAVRDGTARPVATVDGRLGADGRLPVRARCSGACQPSVTVTVKLGGRTYRASSTASRSEDTIFLLNPRFRGTALRRIRAARRAVATVVVRGLQPSVTIGEFVTRGARKVYSARLRARL